MRNDLIALPVFCVVCREPVPINRARRRSNTCTPEHKALREQSLRVYQDLRECRYCQRPSTLAQREAFKSWSRLYRRVNEPVTLNSLTQLTEALPEIVAMLKRQGKKLNERALTELLALVRESTPKDEPEVTTDGGVEAVIQ